MRRLAGIDLTGWRDFAARDGWSVDGEEALDGIVQGGLRAAAVWTGSDGGDPVPVGGPQALLAPHGRGQGWGSIGSAERRLPLAEAFAALTAGADPRAEAALGAATGALVGGAERGVFAIPDMPAFDETAQERFLAMLRSAGIRQPWLLWRPVAACLGWIDDTTSAEAGRAVGIVTHMPEGLGWQVLTLRADRRFPGLLAPERRSAGEAIPWPGGLAALEGAARKRLAAANPGEDTSGTRLAAALALGAPTGAEILRRSNGTWASIRPPGDAPAALPPLPEDLVARLGGVDHVLVASPLDGGLRADLADLVSRAAGPRAEMLPHDTVARGACAAARRLERGQPVYFDFLPQIAVVVLKDGEPVFENLVPADATLPANETYARELDRDFKWPATRETLEFWIERAGSERLRRWTAGPGSAPGHNEVVRIHLEQQPAQGRARIEIRSRSWDALRHRPVRLDWEALPEDPRPREQVLDELRRPLPKYPDRMVLPCGIDAWQEGRRRVDLLELCRRAVGDLSSALPDLAKHIRQSAAVLRDGRPSRVLPVNSDGSIPSGIDPVPLVTVLDDIVRRLLASRDRNEPLRTNNELLVLTWSFSLCPSIVQEELIRMIAQPNHPWRAPRSSDVVLWQGLGRTLESQTLIRKVLDHLLVLAPRDFNRHRRACLAFLLSRKDATHDALAPGEPGRLASLISRWIEADSATGKFGLAFQDALLAAGGLLRYRRLLPRAVVAPDDPDAGRLAAAIETALDGIARLRKPIPAVLRRHDQAVEVLKFLRGEEGDPAILVSLAGGDDTDGTTDDRDDG